MLHRHRCVYKAAMLGVVFALLAANTGYRAAFRQIVGVLNSAGAPYNIAAGTALNWHRNESLAADLDFEIERSWVLQHKMTLHHALRRDGWKQLYVFGLPSEVGYEESWTKFNVRADLFTVDRVRLVPPRRMWLPVPVSAFPLLPARTRREPPPRLPCCAPSHTRCNNHTAAEFRFIPNCELENLHTLLRWVRTVLGKAVVWWITAGTLLSAIRGQGHIPHETNIDVIVNRAAWPLANKLVTAAVGRTHYEFKPTHQWNPARLFWGHVNKVHIDLWIADVTDDATAVIDPHFPSELPARLYFPLTSCKLEGVDYPCPRDSPGLLQLRFGDPYANGKDLALNATTWVSGLTVSGRTFPCYITRLGREQHERHGVVFNTPSPIEPYLVAKYGTEWARPDPLYQWDTSPFRTDRNNCYREAMPAPVAVTTIA